ncbi:helix-turn-helix domain-containing protein [Streptomyces sp. 1222.5]|uniref:helix-turn-helix domain-containing protein n=1 Tax=unclassified Streptomyces TaxID=2593676 RepID=UPI00352598D1
MHADRGDELGDKSEDRGETGEPRTALATLQARLADGLAKSGLSTTQLARRIKVGRTTVSNALNQPKVPSARTVAAIASNLGLDRDDLLELRRQAAAEQGAPDEPRSSRPSARPPSPCRPPTGHAAGSPAASSSPTCTATAPSRSGHRARSRTSSWAPWASEERTSQ